MNDTSQFQQLLSDGSGVHGSVPGAPAFALDFDPTLLFTEGSADHDFDKILRDLDLSLAGDSTTRVVETAVATGLSQPAPNGSDAGGLRQLFGIQTGLSLQQGVQGGGQQQQQQLHGQPVPLQSAVQQQQQQLLQWQAQQLQQQQQAQLQQQQQQQGLGVVYQLPSPFMQPLSALTPGMPLTMYTHPQQPAGLDATTLLLQQQQQQQQLALQGMSAQQQVLLNGCMPGGSPAAAAGPMFTFSALPVPPAQHTQQQPALPMPLAAAAGGAPGLVMLPGAWPAYLQAGGFVAAPAPGAAAFGPAAVHSMSSGGVVLPAAAAAAAEGAAAPRRGRGGRPAAPVAPGAEKPKGPSQRFRERQKATISSLEAEVSQKLAELALLSEENQVLKLRSAVLEAVTSGREYHMKVIKEHGPPTFDVADSSPHSNNDSGPLSHRGSGKSFSAADALADPTAGSDSPHSTTTSNAAAATAAAAAGVAAVAAQAAGEAGSPTVSGDAAAAADACPADPFSCSVDGACAADLEKRSIRCIRQMSSEEITMHWQQFLHDVSEELLTTDDRQDQQRLESGGDQMGLEGLGNSCSKAQACGGAAGAQKQQQQQQEEEPSDDSAFTMSRVCRWCGCTNLDALHLAGCCSTGEDGEGGHKQQQQQQQPEEQQHNNGAAATAAAAAAAAAGGGGSSAEDAAASGAEARVVELVNRYSYMTKFVALLNPGVLYSLFGRNLDTGEAVPYNDQHWRNVVARLHLTKRQVTYILACAELYFSSLSSLMHERQALHEAMVAADGALSECQRRLLGVDGTLDQLSLLDKLSSNLKKEHVLRIMLNCFVWGRILSAVQFAKTAVYSHPFFPDVHAMVCVLYEDCAEKSPDCSKGKIFPHRIQAAKEALAAKSHGTPASSG